MLKQEFERLAKIEVSDETYSKIVEPMYMATGLTKDEFIKILNLKAIAVPRTKEIKKMLVRDRSGFPISPNGCWYHIKYVELVDVDIRTGKFIIRELTGEDLEMLSEEGNDLHYGTCYDFDYLQCVDVKRKPVTLER